MNHVITIGINGYCYGFNYLRHKPHCESNHFPFGIMDMTLRCWGLSLSRPRFPAEYLTTRSKVHQVVVFDELGSRLN